MFALGIKLLVSWFTIAPFPSERKSQLKENTIQFVSDFS